MTHDRQIIITTGNSRKDLNWKRQTLAVSELYQKLHLPNRGVETLDEYVRLSKTRQDDLKDVGGFVAGAMNGGRRKANAVVSRDVITLDFDSIPAFGTDAILQTMDGFGINYCVYSTRKHAPNAPRLRILIPTDRTMTADEYEPCARRMAANIGIGMADPTTFETNRLMYWPSVCADSEYIYKAVDAPFVSVDALLRTYSDWRAFSEWPQVPGTFSYAKLAVRQGDPTAKEGVVGAFCRVYDVYRVISELLPGLYTACANAPDRFTYALGSTTGGAVVYEDGKFLYSHHATDPCSNRLVNAFDLVRLHKFADRDETALDGTPNNRLPSYKAMCEFANGLDEVALELLHKRQEQASAEFEAIIGGGSSGAGAGSDGSGGSGAGSGAEMATRGDGESSSSDAGSAAEDANWQLKLKRNKQTGEIKSTIDNVMLILEHDPRIRGKFALNLFSGRGEILSRLPWSTGEEHGRMWSDTDSNALYWWMEREWGVTGRGNIDSALDVHASIHAFNEVTRYLDGLEWDGVPRLDTLFVDYLGAEDSGYTRAVTRKAFVAAVARAMDPGCKYDQMLILCGPQGVGKSTILNLMSKGWFTDNLATFEGKDASELLQGVWLVEVAELDAFRRSEVSRIKQFLSLKADRYRAAYGRNVRELPRRCVFFGTCNTFDFLQDPTGNRRFWPLDVGSEKWNEGKQERLLACRDQLWAEARVRYMLGEPLYLSSKISEEAIAKQEAHREIYAQEGVIEEFVSRPVPVDWAKFDADRRRDWWAGLYKAEGAGTGAGVELTERQTICAAEIWCELFGRSIGDIKRSDSRDINQVLMNLRGWKRSETPIRCGPYNLQRGFVRREV